MLHEGRVVGAVTSGTMAPYWVFPRPTSEPSGESGKRAVAMALLASDVPEQAAVAVDIRGRAVEARVVPRLLRTDAPPYARPVIRGSRM